MEIKNRNIYCAFCSTPYPDKISYLIHLLQILEEGNGGQHYALLYRSETAEFGYNESNAEKYKRAFIEYIETVIFFIKRGVYY